MALDTAVPLLRRRQVAYALDATALTLPTLGATQAVVPTFEDGEPAIISSDVELVEREGQQSFSKIAQTFGARAAGAQFKNEMYYNGTSLPYWTNLLLGCAMTQGTAGVFTPTSSPNQTVSVA